jgi:hypothetical protein
MHTLPHVEEEHPEKLVEFKTRYYNPEFGPMTMGRAQEERHAQVFAIVRELAESGPMCPMDFRGIDAMKSPTIACAYCGSETDHKPDCLWLRAQKFREEGA